MKLRRVIGAAAGLLLVAATAVACSDDESVFNAEVGECIATLDSLSGNISELPETECTEDHEGEFYALHEHEGDDDDFDADDVQAEATEACENEFEGYMGVEPSETIIEFVELVPTDQSWGEGDRESVCVAYIPGEEVDQSFENAGDDFPREGIFSAEAGDCFADIASASGNISELEPADCTDSHDGEVIGLVQHAGDDDFPGVEAIAEEASAECEGDLFEDYTGTTYDESAIIVTSITPSEESWGAGDRESICVATVGEPVDVSFEGNGDDFLLGASGDDTGDDTTTTVAGDGADSSLDDFADLIESCEGGDMADCDELYLTTPPGSAAEEIGLNCGGRIEFGPGDIPGQCEDTVG